MAYWGLPAELIEILKDLGYKVIERPISINEIIDASNNGSLEEAFGTGTAVGIAMIQEIGYKDGSIHVSHDSPIGQKVFDTINKTRTGKLEDKYQWMVRVENELVE